MSRRKNHIVIPDDPPKGPPFLVDIILLFIAPPLSTFAGIYFLYKRLKGEMTSRQYNDYRHYAAIIGDRASVSIQELASRLHKPVGVVADDLQTMINKGMIDARAYIDRSSMMLYMQDDIIETEFVYPR